LSSLSNLLTNRVRALPRGTCSPRELHILITLADIARDDGIGFSGVTWIAKKALRPERVVYLALQSLRRKGIVVVEREGGGRRKDGSPKRSIWRVVLPAANSLPRPANAQPLNNLRSFPQTFPQVFHNPDQTITVNPDQMIRVNPDQMINVSADQTPTAATGCPVEIAPIRSVRTHPGKINIQEEALPLLEDAEQTMREDRARLAALEHARSVVANLGAAPVARRRRRS
jgi:hypothetical protein